MQEVVCAAVLPKEAEIIGRTYSEQRRSEILAASKRAKRNLELGKVKRGTAEDLLRDIDHD